MWTDFAELVKSMDKTKNEAHKLFDQVMKIPRESSIKSRTLHELEDVRLLMCVS